MSISKYEFLKYFPVSDIWRIQTDGWQAVRGPKNFRDKFYKGMNDGFNFIFKNIKSDITPELIEKIYLSAFAYEEDFKFEDFKKGFNTGSGEFEIFINLQGLENEAGVSTKGIPELAQSLINFSKRESDVKTLSKKARPQISLILDLKSSEFMFDNIIDPLSMNKKDLEIVLKKHLKNTSISKNACLIKKNSSHEDTRVLLFSNKSSRNQIKIWIQNDINAFKKELKGAKSTREKIASIVRFIRQLHQAHYFPDGNGRTFVFLLQNLLFLKNNLGLKMTTYPAHFGGFSTDELTEEAIQDRKLFSRYSVKKCQDFLSNLSSEDIYMEQGRLSNLINKHFDKDDPLIAMAQINEIYKRIVQEEIRCPTDLILKKDYYWNLFFRNSPIDLREKVRVLNALQNLYINKLDELRKNLKTTPYDTHVGYGVKNMTASEVLKSIIDNHDSITQYMNKNLLNDNLTRYQNDFDEMHSKKGDSFPHL